MMGITIGFWDTQCSNTPNFHLGLASHHQLLFVALFIHLTLLLTDLLDMSMAASGILQQTPKFKSHEEKPVPSIRHI
jgi:hypothetical protein